MKINTSGVRSVFVVAALMLAAWVPARAADDPPPAACSAPNVGFQVVTFGFLNVGVWYPTAAAEAAYQYNTDISGSVAKNGPISTCAKYPLVIFSHGYSGCGTQSVFLTEQLARAGYIVAAPDHADAGCSVTSTVPGTPTLSGANPSFTDPSAWNNQSYAYRWVDNENTIDSMLASQKFGPQIDQNKIAMSGHSLGGYDTFAMIGGWSNWLDTRVKAGLMLSPYIQPFQIQNPSAVPIPSVPQMYQGGTLDFGITPFIMKPGGQYDQAQAPKHFLELQGAGHLDFSNKVCGSPTTVQICLSTVANAAFIYNYSAAFLNFYLNNQTSASLWGNGAGLAAFWRDSLATAVSSASFLPANHVAPGEITALFGQGMANATASYTGLPLSANLAGTVVTVTDSKGVARQAGLFFVAPTQVNFQVPPDTATGTATVTVTAGGSLVATGTIAIFAVAPSIFTVDGSGTGLINAYLQTTGVSGYTFPYDSNLAPVPVDVSSGGVYMVTAGTGSLSAYGAGGSALIGNVSVPVSYVGAYPPYAGLDAIVLGPLPASLSGSGMQTISVTIGGVKANPVTILIK